MFVYHENPSGNASFTRRGDAYAINEHLMIAAVADSPLRELVRSNLRRYPQDDYGFDAARIFCKSVVKELEHQTIDTQLFYNALQHANKKLEEFNTSLGKPRTGYLTYDLAETVGVAAIQVGEKLIYGGVEDCYGFVLRGKDFKNIAPFEKQIKHASDYVEHVTHEKMYFHEFPDELIQALPELALWEPTWCVKLRNNPDIKNESGDLVGWGCFTGEKNVEDFIQVHEVNLAKGDHIFLVSDGCLPLIENSEFLTWFTSNVKETFGFSGQMHGKIKSSLGENDINKEKTLIYWKV